MRVTLSDLQKRPNDIVKALDRNQPITLFYRGKAKGIIVPASNPHEKNPSIVSHRAFGMWRDRTEMKSVHNAVAKLRETRHTR